MPPRAAQVRFVSLSKTHTAANLAQSFAVDHTRDLFCSSQQTCAESNFIRVNNRFRNKDTVTARVITQSETAV